MDGADSRFELDSVRARDSRDMGLGAFVRARTIRTRPGQREQMPGTIIFLTVPRCSADTSCVELEQIGNAAYIGGNQERNSEIERSHNK